MFDTLSDSLQTVFKRLKGYGRLTERNIKDALREVRLALLEADVNYQVAKDFIERVREQCMGEEVLGSITPGQQVIKRVHDELVRLLGERAHAFDLSAHPARIMLIGLHGAGKTTTAAKLAHKWKKAGKQVLLAACDIRRPAAVEQLRVLARQIDVPLVAPHSGESVPDIARRADEEARRTGADMLILDTGGRFQMDDELVQELKDVRKAINPRNLILVLDAATGQEAVDVATHFHQALGITGLILSKLDGDARGGAALSVQAVTGCPILLTGTGEKIDQIDDFHPERMASRILGMGDVVSLVEKAQLSFEQGEMERIESQLKKKNFDLNDFLEQFRMMKKMGPIEHLIEMLPLPGGMPAKAREQMRTGHAGDQIKHSEAILLSMTRQERTHPNLIDASRKRRIARGSGVEVSQVNDLLRAFSQARKMTKQLKKMQKGLRRPKK